MIADNQALFEGRNNYVKQLAKDLKDEFPDMKGFSVLTYFISANFTNSILIPQSNSLLD